MGKRFKIGVVILKRMFYNIKMLGSKGLLTPLIPDCSALCAPAILKNIQNPP